MDYGALSDLGSFGLLVILVGGAFKYLRDEIKRKEDENAQLRKELSESMIKAQEASDERIKSQSIENAALRQALEALMSRVSQEQRKR